MYSRMDCRAHIRQVPVQHKKSEGLNIVRLQTKKNLLQIQQIQNFYFYISNFRLIIVFSFCLPCWLHQHFRVAYFFAIGARCKQKWILRNVPQNTKMIIFVATLLGPRENSRHFCIFLVGLFDKHIAFQVSVVIKKSKLVLPALCNTSIKQ